MPIPRPSRSRPRAVRAPLYHAGAFALIVLAGTSCVPADHGFPEGGVAPAADTAASLGGDSWSETVQAAIAADSSAFHADGMGFTAASNGITARVSKGNVRIAAGGGALGLRFSGWGRQQDVRPTEARLPTLGACTTETGPEGDCIRRVETDQDGVTEWFAATEGGVEQGWTLDQRPEGDDALVFEVALDGGDLEVNAGTNEGSVVDASGAIWRVSGVAAWDANGEPLPATLAGEGDLLQVVVDDAGATYPIEVDPVYTTASTTLLGSSATSYFGGSVAGAGDVNNDGFDDVIVGAFYQGSGTGAAYVYHGSATGLATTASTTLATASGYFGYSVDGAGDVNNDGYADVIVGAYNAGGSYGRSYVYHGSSTGLSTTPTTLSASGAVYFGYSVSGAGDVNNDGYDDVIVGAAYSTAGIGMAYVFLGASGGIAATPVSTLAGTAGSNYGYVVSEAGDINGDGYDEVVVTDVKYNSNSGRAYVYSGSSLGTSTSPATLDGPTGSYFGRAAAGAAGDVNSDGYGDLIVGADYGGTGGAAYIYHGSASGIPSTATTTLVNSGYPTVSQFGHSAAGAGDVDNDGYDDVVVGAYGTYGSATVYHGSAAGVVTAGSSTVTGPSASSRFALSADGAGDVNGDGFADVIVGAEGYSSYTGAAYVYQGLSAVVDADDDGYASTEDCDDDNPDVNPGATETCDDVDNDCDDAVDEGVMVTGYADIDEDGYGDPSNTAAACTMPAGYLADDTDCDDWDDQIHPGQDEYCDGVDNDCDGSTDGSDALDPMQWFADADGDSYGDPAVTGLTCDLPADATYDDTDCDDTRALVNSDGTEDCNGYDDNCDGDIDEAGALNELTWYADDDADGFGNVGVTALGCNLPTGFVADTTDCDDTDSAVSPSATEACNLIDDNCDTVVDEAGATGETVFYADADQDGHGDIAYPSNACFDTASTSELDDDCDDTTATTYTGAPEYCNEVDDDCNNVIDDPAALDAITWYRDADLDGYGVSRRPLRACEVGEGYVTNDTDCRPTDAASYPGAPEACDSIDNSCDGVVDEAGSVGQPTWYTDADGDTYGAGSVSYSCTQPVGAEASDTDCDDASATVYPGAAESCNTIDDDCDGSTDEAGADGEVARYLDEDGDTFGDAATAVLACDPIEGRINDGTDCDDTVSSTYPGASERCDGVQNNCSISPWSSASEDGEVWLSNGGAWTSYTAAWTSGTDGSPATITLPANGTLNVCDGTYYVGLTASAAGTLDVEGMYDGAVLSGGGVGSVVTASGASTTLNLLGLTLEDGAGSGTPKRGGGLRVSAGTVTVDGCLLQSSTAASGGGFAVTGGTLTMTDSEVSYNMSTSTTANTGGGGWYQGGGTVSLTDTDVVYNTAARDGGGGYLSAGTFTDTRGEVSYNSAQYNGGGMRLTGASTLTGSSVSYNTATTGSGGGVYHATSTLTMNTPVVQGNTAAGSGGGVYQGAGALTCVGSTSANSGFFANTAAIAGGVYLPSTSTFRSTVCGFGDTTPTNNTPTDIKDGSKTYNYGNYVTFYCSGGSCK